ncbi:hypothetical protein L6452_37662 [Arctium lappa]|uniref:Uncharacterized protein n=1 Tax=Arctium lappa TaxID=4217 RepID=A0ACB8Y538_ARCLA|nr:hypothetical protein L6452_37662 [Arctium lappa]
MVDVVEAQKTFGLVRPAFGPGLLASRLQCSVQTSTLSKLALAYDDSDWTPVSRSLPPALLSSAFWTGLGPVGCKGASLESKILRLLYTDSYSK